MGRCAGCGAELSGLPYECSYCGHEHCTNCRFPERHECPGLPAKGAAGDRWFVEYGSPAAPTTDVDPPTYEPDGTGWWVVGFWLLMLVVVVVVLAAMVYGVWTVVF